MSERGEKVLVAMSGGVDSSVAAALLKEAGHEVVGCFMRLGSPGESLEEGVVDPASCDPDKIKIGHQGCCSVNDAKDAQRVAARLDIPFYVLNFKRDFSQIIDYFVREYNAGRTPNPCARCNDWLKFGKLADYARSIDADAVATGHYARLETLDGRPALLRGVDREKDQTYVLFGTHGHNLSRMKLPVGHRTKPDIRRVAASLGLPVSEKPDSQEICFVPDGDYMGLVRRRTPDAVQTGEIRDTHGNLLGHHSGQQRFTVGQRRGLGIAVGHPLYVVDRDAETNTVIVGTKDELDARGLLADQTNWLVEPPTDEPIPCEVKIRSNAPPVGATVQATGDDELRVWFDEPQKAVAPGQVVVCYEGDRVLGGGWIRGSADE